MVKLQEVEDEHFTQDQPAPSGSTALPKDVLLADEEDDDMAYSDTDSSITDEDSATLALAKADDDQDDDDASIEDETLFDRVYALRDMIPPKQRVALASSFETGRDWVKTGLRLGGKTLWVVSTSVMLVGMTYALAFADEAQAIEAEKEMRMQQTANEILAPGATSVINQHLGGAGQGSGQAEART